MKLTSLLIDGDVWAFRQAAASEEEIDWGNGKVTFRADLPEAISSLDDKLEWFKDRMAADKVFTALSAPRNFRYDVLPTYKANRRGKRKPILLRALKDHLKAKWEAVEKPHLEADDVLGIWATWPKMKGKKIIVTVDKDLKQVPGWLWLGKDEEPAMKIDQHSADFWHMRQTLTGDPVDGYTGLPGIGPVKADTILNDLGGVNTVPFWWLRIVGAYEKKGLTEADALVQARVARICRASDYDFEKKEPILWAPPTSN